MFLNTNCSELMRQLMRQLMGINGEKILFWNTNCSEIERMNERQKPEKPLRLMQTALTSL